MDGWMDTDAKDAVFIDVLLHKEKSKLQKVTDFVYVVVLLLMFKHKTYYYLYAIYLCIDLKNILRVSRVS